MTKYRYRQEPDYVYAPRSTSERLVTAGEWRVESKEYLFSWWKYERTVPTEQDAILYIKQCLRPWKIVVDA